MVQLSREIYVILVQDAQKEEIVHFGGENLPASKLRMRNTFFSPPPGGVMGLARRRCTKEVIVHLSGETYRLAVKLNKNTLHKL